MSEQNEIYFCSYLYFHLRFRHLGSYLPRYIRDFLSGFPHPLLIVITTYNTATINTATITKNFCCYCCFPRNLAKIDWSRPPKSIYKLAVSFRSQDFVYGPNDEQTVLSWWGPSWLVMFVWGGKGPEAVSFILTNVFFHIK